MPRHCFGRSYTSRRVCAAAARHGKIFPRGPTRSDTAEKSSRGQQATRRPCATTCCLFAVSVLWGSRARRKVPVEFYTQLSGRENKHFSNSRSLTLRTVIGCAPTRQGRGRERWLILLEDINSYPEMCAEHVLSRSTSTPPIPVSAFFTAFFHSRARASSTGRAVTVLEYGYF